jgi:hypothetical protein
MPSLIDEVMAGILILSFAIGVAMDLKEGRRKNLPVGKPILNSRVQKVILLGCGGLCDLLYLVLAPFLLLFGYFDQLSITISSSNFWNWAFLNWNNDVCGRSFDT